MGRHRPWELEETEFLRRNFGIMPIEDIATKLGRSFHAVTSHAAFKGIKSHKPRQAERIAAVVREPEPTRYPPQPFVRKRVSYDPTPCMERDLDYVR